MSETRQSKTSPRHWREAPHWLQYALVTAVVLVVSLANFFLKPVVGVHATALLFLLAVVLLALLVERGPVFLAAALSAAIWDYFFLPPVFEFRVYTFEDAALLMVYFVVALVLGQLMLRTRTQEKARRLGEERATALYLLMRELAGLIEPDATLPRVVQQMRKIFSTEIALWLAESPKHMAERAHPASSFAPSEAECQWARKVFEYGALAGKSVGSSTPDGLLFTPLISGDGIVGVMALKFGAEHEPVAQHRKLLDAFTRQIAIALDRHRLRAESDQARLLAESERLSKTLLNSVSHEIRTPIAAIKSATSHLAEASDVLAAPQRAMLAEIQEATDRLDRFVGKALELARLESGRVNPKPTLCDVGDLVHTAVKETRAELTKHKLTVDIAAGLPLVAMDFVLTQQALINLLSNAAMHTPSGTAIRLNVCASGTKLMFIVADDGPGIPARDLPRVFDKFYRGTNAATGGTGLGLSLVKGFIEAQHGTVRAENISGHGAAFTLCLPLGRMIEN